MTVHPLEANQRDLRSVPHEVVRELRDALAPERVSTDPVTNAAYARDASPLAIKAAADGKRGPAVVIWPESTAEVASLVNVARLAQVPLVPYGGGSGIVGGALDRFGGIVVDLKRMTRVIGVDRVSQTVTVQPGILGERLEVMLNRDGFTTGHYPQSLRSSTIGGWIAHRGVGTFSTKYGKVDDLVVALEVVLPNGEVLRTRAVPQSAAGPDLNRLFLGAEGTLGIITEATLRIYEAPATRSKMAFAFRSFEEALTWIRTAVQRGCAPAACRVYDAEEAAVNFPELHLTFPEVLAIAIAEGDPAPVSLETARLREWAVGSSATELDSRVVDLWLARRFNTASFVRTLMTDTGVADSLEVANEWARLAETYRAMKAAMEVAAGPAGRVYGHASHFYHTGANLYMIFHAFAEPGAVLANLYDSILESAFRACHATGGTLTHHHGVGLSKGRWMLDELGAPGLGLLTDIKAALDPTGFMNPGKLGIAAGLER